MRANTRRLIRKGGARHRPDAPGPRAGLAGFSLMEAMISGSILLLGLAGVLTGLGSMNTQYKHQRHMTQALQIAESTMESLLVRGKESDDLDEGEHQGQDFDQAGTPLAGEGFFHSAWTVAPAGIAGVPGIRVVTVTISWENQLRPVTLTTYRD